MNGKIVLKAFILLALLSAPAVFAQPGLVAPEADTPADAPADAPITVPVTSPVSAPITAPITAPTTSPSAAPTGAPAGTPVTSPVSVPEGVSPVEQPASTPASGPVTVSPSGPEPTSPSVAPSADEPSSPAFEPSTDSPADGPELSPESTVPSAIPAIAPAPVGPSSFALLPFAHCWESAAIGNSTVVKVYFGYQNRNTSAITIAAGNGNRVTGVSSSVSVPTTFAVGDRSYALTVTASAGQTVTWVLNNHTASINTNTNSLVCSRSKANTTVVLTYNVDPPAEGLDRDEYVAELRTKIANITSVTNFFLTITDTGTAKRQAGPSFTTTVAVPPATSGPSNVAAAAALAQSAPADLAVAGYTPTGVASEDSSLVVPPPTNPVHIPSPSGLSDGSIAGIVIGSFAALLIVIIIIYIIVARATDRGSSRTSSQPATRASAVRAASATAASTSAAKNPVSDTEEDTEEEDEEEDEDEEDDEESSEEEDEEEEQSEEESSEEEESEQEDSEESSSEERSSEEESSEEESD